MSSHYASRLSYQAFTASGAAGALTVASGSAVRVLGIAFRAASAAVYTITDGSDNTLWTYSVGANSSDCVSVPTIYDSGIKVQSNQTDGAVTVFHLSPGF